MHVHGQQRHVRKIKPEEPIAVQRCYQPHPICTGFAISFMIAKKLFTWSWICNQQQKAKSITTKIT